MNIYITGEVDSDIYESFRIIRNKIQLLITEIIKQKDYFSDYTEISFYFIISDGVKSEKEKIKLKKKKKEIEVNAVFDYNEFKKGNDFKKTKMLIESIFNSIKLLEKQEITTYEDAKEIINNINQVI